MHFVILGIHLSPELIDTPLLLVPWHDLGFVLLLDLALVQQHLGATSIPLLEYLIPLHDLFSPGLLLADLPLEYFDHCGPKFIHHDPAHLR